VTTYHFTGAVAWNRTGPFVTSGRGIKTKSITDPATGLVPAGLTQNSVAVTSLTTDTYGAFSFNTTDVPGVLVDWGFGPFMVYANEVPALAVASSAPTDTQVSTLVTTGGTATRTSLEARYAAKFYTGDKTLYVSPANGSDSNDGRSMGTPLATLTAAATALSSGGRIMFLPGSLQLAGSVILNGRSDLVIEGAGPNLSQVVVNGNYDAFQVTGTSARVTFRNLWVGSFAARTSGLGFNVTGTSGQHATDITLDNVVIQNTAQAALSQYVDLMSWRRVKYIQSITSAAIAGSLFRVISSASHDFDRVVVQRTTAGNIASDALTLDSDTDTMLLNHCELLNANRGMLLQNSIGGSSTGPRLVRATDCFTEAMTSSGVVVTAGRDAQFKGHEAAVNGGSGFDISGGTAVDISDGSLALQNQLHGFYFHGTGVNGASVQGSKASNNSQASHASYDGCRIEDNTTHVNATGNRFGDYFFTLTNKQRYGLSIGSVATDYIVAGNNDLNGNATGGLGNFSSGTHNAIGTGGNVS
jgi:hypothetical protein